MAQTTSGISVGISIPLPATEDEAGYDALTFNTIGQLTNLDGLGRVFQEVTTDPLAERRTGKFKGNYNEGSPSITVNYEAADQGQLDLETALGMDTNVAFSITLQDGTIIYFSAKVMSNPFGSMSANQMLTKSIQVSIDTDTIVKAP